MNENRESPVDRWVPTSRSRVAITLVMAACVASSTVGPAQARPRRAKGTHRAKDELVELVELNAHAQECYAEGDYDGAALAWSTILRTLPESDATREQRATHMLVVLDTSVRAYEQRREAAQDKSELRSAMEPLQRAVEVLEAYEAAFARAYGEDAALPTEVTIQGAALLDRLAASERELAVPPPPPPAPAPTVPKPAPEPVAELREEASPQRGTDLLVGGSLLIVAGAAGAAVVGIVAPRLSGARRTDFMVPGLIGSAGLLAGGVAMVVVGAKRRRMLVAPTLSSTTAGLSLAGRF